VAAMVALLFCAQANASPIGFNGFYDYSTWTRTDTSYSPMVSTIDGPQQVLTLYEPDGTCCFGQEFDFSHAVQSSGTVSFDWTFDPSIDPCCSGMEFYVNSTLYNLSGSSFPCRYCNFNYIQSGSFSIAVNAGDIITFGAFSDDSCCRASA